jgi:hypothetical protein
LHTFTPVSVSYHYRLTTVQNPITVWLTHCGLLPKAELDHHIPEALHRFELYFKLAVIFAAPLSKRLGAAGGDPGYGYGALSYRHGHVGRRFKRSVAGIGELSLSPALELAAICITLASPGL